MTIVTPDTGKRMKKTETTKKNYSKPTLSKFPLSLQASTAINPGGSADFN